MQIKRFLLLIHPDLKAELLASVEVVVGVILIKTVALRTAMTTHLYFVTTILVFALPSLNSSTFDNRKYERYCHNYWRRKLKV